MFDLEHGDKAREPLRQQIDPASTRKAPPLGIMHRYAPIQQARRELQSEQDRDCRKSAFPLRAKHLSHDTWRDTLAISLGETASLNATNARHPSADFTLPCFASAVPIFHEAFRSRKEPLSIRMTCPVAFAHDVFLRAVASDHRVPVVQLWEQARGLSMTRSSN
ncbi:MAG TPA: hypothetical protein VK567_20330 [Bradyrhizobium sp.]|nr:hypothetical protein [Bradyrhizobium sp.]